MSLPRKNLILPILILSQFACTSLWFAGNAIVDELAFKTGIGLEITAFVLTSVQLGFIIGTLVFALLMIADRFSPSKVFFVCAVLAAFCNFSLMVHVLSKEHLLFARFGTGFFLAGIYPVGMKIAADYYENGLGKALGLLVGALVFGTAFPFLIGGLDLGENYQMVLTTTSALSIIGGGLIYFFVPNGPFRKPSTKLQLKAGIALFRIADFRTAAFGYFGHMWELYAFWAFTPIAIKLMNLLNQTNHSVHLYTFLTIAVGGLSCMIGGYFSQRFGSYKVALYALLISGCFCLFSPLLFNLPPYLFIIAWCIWGMAVTADSPQFSSLVAQAAPSQFKGTGLTLVNCLGFAISIASIQLVSFIAKETESTFIFIFLACGPLFGVYHLIRGKQYFS
jgi:MFS family permease